MLQCFEAAAKVTFDYDWNKYIGSHLYFSGQARLDEEDSNGCFKNLGAKCRSYKIMKKQPPEDFRLKTANLDSVRWAQLFLHLWKNMFVLCWRFLMVPARLFSFSVQVIQFRSCLYVFYFGSLWQSGIWGEKFIFQWRILTFFWRITRCFAWYTSN